MEKINQFKNIKSTTLYMKSYILRGLDCFLTFVFLYSSNYLKKKIGFSKKKKKKKNWVYNKNSYFKFVKNKR